MSQVGFALEGGHRAQEELSLSTCVRSLLFSREKDKAFDLKLQPRTEPGSQTEARRRTAKKLLEGLSTGLSSWPLLGQYFYLRSHLLKSLKSHPGSDTCACT